MSAMVMIIVKDPLLDLIPPLSLPAAGECPVFEPFRCPKEGLCISIQVEIRPHFHTIFLPNQYLCDGAPDCVDAYDEDPRLCTAGNS